MKKYSRFLLTLAAVFALALIMKMPVEASGNLKQVGCTANSVTVSWTPPTMSSNEKITGYMLSADNGVYVNSNIAATATSASITLPANYVGYLRIYYSYSYRSYDGTTKNYDNYYLDSTYVNTALSTPAKNAFAATGVLTYTGKVCFDAARYNTYHHVQMQIFKGNSSSPCNTINFTSSTGYIPVSKNVAYRFRIRYYYQNTDNGTTYFSAWSPYRGFMLNNIKYIKKGNNFTLKFKKVKNVSKYVVKTSKKLDSGFKKAKSFKAKNKKSYSVKVPAKKKKYFRIYTYLKLKEFKGISDIIIRNTY